MTKAEQRALEVYPDYPTMDGGYVTQRRTRKVFIQGYEQAEKDTIERACEWLSRHYDIDLAYFRKAMEEE